MTAHPSELTGSIAVLRRARSRKRIWLVLNAAVWASFAGLVTFILLGGIRLFQPQLWSAWFEAGAGAFVAEEIALCIMMMALAILLPIAAMRTPKLLSLAKSADRVFSLQERLSTALEFAQAPSNRPSAVRAALFSDVARHAHVIEPKSLAPLNIPHILWAMPALIGIAALLLSAPLPPLPAAGVQKGAATAADQQRQEVMSGEEREAAAAEMRRISNLIADQAEERSDPFMQAVARTLGMLGSEVATDLSLDRSDILTELEHVSDYARQGSERWGDETGTKLTELLHAAGRQIDPNMLPSGATDARSRGELSRMPAKGGADQDNSSPAAETNPNATQVPEQGRQGTKDGLVQDEMTKLSSSDAGDESGSSGGEGTPTTAAANNYSMVQRDAQRQTQRADAIGDFEQSRDGNFSDPMANPWGGETSQATDSVPGAEEGGGGANVEFETDAELMLEAGKVGAGRRVRKDTPPTAQFTKVEDRASSAGNPNWSRLEEAEVSRPYLGPEVRDLVSAYFMGRNRQVGE